MVNDSVVENTAGRVLNAVTLQSAVLCADCEVISDSPHDRCLVCGSHSLFNIARVFGGCLPKERTTLIAKAALETRSPDTLAFPKTHKFRRRATTDSRLLFALDEKNSDEANRSVLVGQKA